MQTKVGNQTFSGLSASLEKKGANANDFSILGNAVLKRFNIIIDNRNGYIYLKSNSLMNEPFENTKLIIYSSIVGVISICSCLNNSHTNYL